MDDWLGLEECEMNIGGIADSGDSSDWVDCNGEMRKGKSINESTMLPKTEWQAREGEVY